TARTTLKDAAAAKAARFFKPQGKRVTEDNHPAQVDSRQHSQKLQLRTAGTGRPLGDIDSPSGPDDACNNFPTMGDSHPWHVFSQTDLGRRHTAAAIFPEAPFREDPRSKERDRWT